MSIPPFHTISTDTLIMRIYRGLQKQTEIQNDASFIQVTGHRIFEKKLPALDINYKVHVGAVLNFQSGVSSCSITVM